MKNLLQIIKAAQGELGLPQSSSVIGNTDQTTIQMLSLAQRAIDEIRRWDHRWTACQFEYDLVVNVPIITTGNIGINSPVITNIPTTAGIVANAWAVVGNSIPAAARVLSVDSPTQITMTMEASLLSPITNAPVTFAQDTYPIPIDFDFYNNRTMWDRTNRWELLGPDSPQMDQWHRSGIVVTGPRRHFRQVGPYNNNFRIWPAPIEIAEPLQLVFEYLSLNCVQQNPQSGPTTYSQYFLNDTDTPILDDQSVIMGVKWMFWEAKGFNYADMKNRWQDYVNRQAARDGAAAALNMVKRVNPIFISPANVQDGFFPGPVGPNQA
jgi:hypothetical protein